MVDRNQQQKQILRSLTRLVPAHTRCPDSLPQLAATPRIRNITQLHVTMQQNAFSIRSHCILQPVKDLHLQR